MLPKPHCASSSRQRITSDVEQLVGAFPETDALVQTAEPPERLSLQVGALRLRFGRSDQSRGSGVCGGLPVVALKRGARG